MLDSLGPLTIAPDDLASAHDRWPDEGLSWVAEPRKSAPGLNSLLRWAFSIDASRVAFQTGHPVWVRVHGRNRRATLEAVDESEISSIANHLYAADGSARLQGGSDFDVAYEIPVDRTTRLRFRLNATPTRTSRHSGANIVLRPIADMPASLAAQNVEQAILDAYRPRDGIVAVSGSTGSGKSTLIAALTVAKLEDPDSHCNIAEAAAPVEFLLERRRYPSSTINQTEVPRDLPSFEAFIRGCMRREETDIIVGECRDSPTMTAAVNAAMTGSLLTTTIHANDVALTIQRMESLLPEAERRNLVSAVAQALRLVVNQRLVPSTDGRRTAIREFLVFDAPLRTRLLQTRPDEWGTLTRRAIEEQGQSYAVSIRAALEAGRITEQTAAHEMREIG